MQKKQKTINKTVFAECLSYADCRAVAQTAFETARHYNNLNGNHFVTPSWDEVSPQLQKRMSHFVIFAHRSVNGHLSNKELAEDFNRTALDDDNEGSRSGACGNYFGHYPQMASSRVFVETMKLLIKIWLEESGEYYVVLPPKVTK